MDKMLFVGLGNPGREFIKTRHNLGIRVLSLWFDRAKEQARSVKDWRRKDSLSAEWAQVHLEDRRIDVLFPLTYMNESGKSVAAYLNTQDINHEQILIVHDDLETPFGEVKFKEGGGAAGHKGVRSIQQYLGTQDIPRLRVGIGRPPNNVPVDKFVLQRFTPEEETGMNGVYAKAASLINSRLVPK